MMLFCVRARSTRPVVKASLESFWHSHLTAATAATTATAASAASARSRPLFPHCTFVVRYEKGWQVHRQLNYSQRVFLSRVTCVMQKQ